MSRPDIDAMLGMPHVDTEALAREIERIGLAGGAVAVAEGLAPFISDLLAKATPSAEQVVFQPHWPTALQRDGFHEFRCDDKGLNGRTWMRVMVAPDGDTHVAMQEWEDHPEGEPSLLPTVRCRTGFGGGRHERTHQALLWLALAIQLDNAEITSRRGASTA